MAPDVDRIHLRYFLTLPAGTTLADRGHWNAGFNCHLEQVAHSLYGNDPAG